MTDGVDTAWGEGIPEKNLLVILHFSRRNHHLPSVDICVIGADVDSNNFRDAFVCGGLLGLC